MNQTMNVSVTNLLTNISQNSSDLIADSLKNINNNTTIIIFQSDASKIDPNWFYSSSAQCAAAIVGLMGAFLVTKLINQKSFVNQLKNEISDYKTYIPQMYTDVEFICRFAQNYPYNDGLNFKL